MHQTLARASTLQAQRPRFEIIALVIGDGELLCHDPCLSRPVTAAE
jgi:hypothetical protein